MCYQFENFILTYDRFAKGHDDTDTTIALESDRVTVGDEGRFGHAVALDNEAAEFLLHRLDCGMTQRSCSTSHQPQRTQIVLAFDWMFGHLDHNGRYYDH